MDDFKSKYAKEFNTFMHKIVDWEELSEFESTVIHWSHLEMAENWKSLEKLHGEKNEPISLTPRNKL